MISLFIFGRIYKTGEDQYIIFNFQDVFVTSQKLCINIYFLLIMDPKQFVALNLTLNAFILVVADCTVLNNISHALKKLKTRMFIVSSKKNTFLKVELLNKKANILLKD